MSISDRLAAITARADEATAEPWSTGPLTVVHSTGTEAMVQTVAQAIARSDAEFIAHARSDVPWLVEQVRKRDTALQEVRNILFTEIDGDLPDFALRWEIEDAIEVALRKGA